MVIYACVEPLIDPLLPKKHAGFRRGKSTEDQVVLPTQNIEDSFEAKKKADAVFVEHFSDKHPPKFLKKLPKKKKYIYIYLKKRSLLHIYSICFRRATLAGKQSKKMETIKAEL